MNSILLGQVDLSSALGAWLTINHADHERPRWRWGLLVPRRHPSLFPCARQHRQAQGQAALWTLREVTSRDSWSQMGVPRTLVPELASWWLSNVYHLGLGVMSRELRSLPLLWRLPAPSSHRPLVGEHGPGGRPCVAKPWSLWSLSFLEPRVYGNIALGCCWEREGSRRLTHTATSVPIPHPRATWPHTLIPTLSAFMQALTPTHTLCTHMHTPFPTHTHTDTAFTPTCSLMLTCCGTGPAREHPSRPQAGSGRLPLSTAAVHGLLPLVPAWGLCFLTYRLGGGLLSTGTGGRLDVQPRAWRTPATRDPNP